MAKKGKMKKFQYYNNDTYESNTICMAFEGGIYVAPQKNKKNSQQGYS